MARCMVLFVEGVEPTLLDSLVDSGRLPWFAAAREAGTTFPLDCGPVPYEPTNLATALCGVGPGEHGCYSYWDVHAATRPPRILESSDVRAPWMWQWEELADVEWGIVNVQLTHPPKPLRGALLTYPMQPSLRICHPPNLLHDLIKRDVRYAADVSVFYRGHAPQTFFESVLDVAERQLDAEVELAQEVDVLIANLTIADRLSHFLWHEVEEGRERLGRAPYVVDAYEFLDHAVARLAERVEEGGTVLVASEIGFGPLDGFARLDDWLQEVGLQRRHDDGRIDVVAPQIGRAHV